MKLPKLTVGRYYFETTAVPQFEASSPKPIARQWPIANSTSVRHAKSDALSAFGKDVKLSRHDSSDLGTRRRILIRDQSRSDPPLLRDCSLLLFRLTGVSLPKYTATHGTWPADYP